MVSGTLTVTTTPQSLQGAATASVSGGRLFVQIIGTGTVIVGGKAGVTAGNGIQITSASGPVDVGASNQITNLTDVYVATIATTAVLMWTAN